MSTATMNAFDRANARRRAVAMGLRKLDARVEQEVFGRSVVWYDYPNVRRCLWVRDHSLSIAPRYSESEDDAFLLVRKMLARGCDFTLAHEGTFWRASFGTFGVAGPTPSVAIVNAALRHVEEFGR
jgi:hypothetical protein